MIETNRRIIHDIQQSILDKVTPFMAQIDRSKYVGTTRNLERAVVLNDAVEDDILMIGVNGIGNRPVL